MMLVPFGFWAAAAKGETTAFFLKGKDFGLLLDVGLNPSRAAHQAGVKLTSLTHVFISHSHADHFQGFPSLVFSRAVQERTEGKAPPLTIVASKRMQRNCRTLLKLFYPERTFDLQWEEVDAGENLDVGEGARLSFFAVNHAVECLGLTLVAEERKVLAYTADTAFSEELVAACMGAETLLGECFGLKEDFGPLMSKLRHLSAEEVGVLADRIGTKQLVLFHMQPQYDVPEKKSALLQRIREHFSGEIIFPQELKAVTV